MSEIELLTSAADLERFCEMARQCRFVAIDTEFIRDRTYYPQLCLLQMAVSSEGRSEMALFDPLSPDFQLEPIGGLLSDESTVKVLHAARQDLELFLLKLGILPKPVFDTQIAAQVCGFGDQVSYEALVAAVKNVRLDRTSKITDWARRPLTAKQLKYAASDVDHLRDIYPELENRLDRSGRRAWIEEETARLTEPSTYLTRPEDAWLRIKRRKGPPVFQAALRELAAYREELARKWDRPRQWVMRDEALLEIAGSLPSDLPDLNKLRFLNKSSQRGRVGTGILAAVKKARQSAVPADAPGQTRRDLSPNRDISLLRVLLKVRAKQMGVAEKLVATTDDLQAVISGNPRARPLTGWRREMFGEDALRLCRGQAALTMSEGKARLITVPAKSPGGLRER